MKAFLIVLLIGIIVYEIVEHLVIPLIFAIRYRRRSSAYGPSGLIGKHCVVMQWEGTRGKVRMNGELWNAVSHRPLISGSEAVVKEIRNLTLLVAPSGN